MRNKIFWAIAMLISLNVSALGQTAPVVKQSTTKQTTKHMTKSGTPDKRYKENKTTVVKSGPVKKDGTPDMRYKANQQTRKTQKVEKIQQSTTN